MYEYDLRAACFLCCPGNIHETDDSGWGSPSTSKTILDEELFRYGSCTYPTAGLVISFPVLSPRNCNNSPSQRGLLGLPGRKYTVLLNASHWNLYLVQVFHFSDEWNVVSNWFSTLHYGIVSSSCGHVTLCGWMTAISITCRFAHNVCVGLQLSTRRWCYSGRYLLSYACVWWIFHFFKGLICRIVSEKWHCRFECWCDFFKK